jgi:hypothetical protein
MAAEPQRPDGWIVTYVVEVVFDTNVSRTRYDHVGTVSRCTGCGERIDAASFPAALLRHARLHDPTRVADGANGPRPCRDANSGDGQLAVDSLRREEVTTEHTTV